MTRRANYAGVAWAVILAITLAACGSDSTPTTTPVTSANITFKTDPAASVWIDGENQGVTPIVVAVEAGSREVVLKAEGFEDMKETITVEAGKDLTVDTGLMLAGTEVADYKRLLATLGIEHEGYGEAPKAHRGYGDKSVMLYWPQGTMRRASLGTYRIEVTPAYEDDGYIVFKKGKNELHREKFEAQDLITEKALPASVVEAMKAGGSYSWGIYYDSKRKKPDVAKFKLATKSKERAFDKKLTKIKKRKSYQRLDPVMKAMANVDLLRNSRYYSEALSFSMSMVNTWPDTQMPFKSIAFCLERLKLKDTALYEAVGESLRGSGRFSPKKSGFGGIKTDLGHRKGGQSFGIPTPLVAPRVRPDTGGLKGPGGMGVQPTPDAQKRKPGPIVPGPTDEGPSDTGPTDPRGRTENPRDKQMEGLIEDTKTQIAEGEELLGHLEEAQAAETEALAEAKRIEAIERGLQNDLQNAQSALSALEAQERATPGSVSATDMQAAKDAVETAQGKVQQAAEHAARAFESAQSAARRNQELKDQHGSIEDNQAKLQGLKDELERLETMPQPGVPGTGVPGTDPRTTDPKDPLNPKLPTPEDEAAAREQAVQNARSELANAQDSARRDTQWMQDAETEANQALTDLRAAEAALQAGIDGGATPAQITALEEALGRASAEDARARMNLERAQAAVGQSQQRIQDAEAALEAAESP
ncbi:MAG: PEGA domain-containing protein [Planctomycetota bacterium]|nr:PEGA domain-containing protein [Planctomycetota bacterium]